MIARDQFGQEGRDGDLSGGYRPVHLGRCLSSRLVGVCRDRLDRVGERIASPKETRCGESSHALRGFTQAKVRSSRGHDACRDERLDSRPPRRAMQRARCMRANCSEVLVGRSGGSR